MNKWLSKNEVEGIRIMSKWDENKEQKEENLFDTAYRLFIDKGFQQTTISDIVQKAGVAKGTFYLYFKDKYDIRDRIIIKKTYALISEAIEELEKDGVESFEAQLLFIVDYIVDYLDANQALLNFMHRDLILGIYKNAFSKMIRQNSEMTLMDLFVEGAKNNHYVMEKPEYVFCMILELISTVAFSSIVLKEPGEIETVKPYLRQSILGIINVYKVS